jgi:hypothetical protein
MISDMFKILLTILTTSLTHPNDGKMTNFDSKKSSYKKAVIIAIQFSKNGLAIPS